MGEKRSALAEESAASITHLRRFEGEEIVYFPNPGNGGDALIFCATIQQLDAQGVRYVLYEKGMNLEGKVVLYPGGGNLVPYYHYARRFIESHHHKLKHLVILPHTIDSNEDLLGDLGANVDIFCRDPVSFAHVVKNAPNVHVHLSHDLALGFDVNRFTEQIRRGHPCRALHYRKRNWKQYLDIGRRVLSGASLRDVKRGNRRLNAFRTDVERSTKAVPAGNVDLSHEFRPKTRNYVEPYNSVAAMINVVNLFDEIHTNRLHVMILAALLEKEVQLYEGSYFKNRAVYEHSIVSNFSNVHLIT